MRLDAAAAPTAVLHDSKQLATGPMGRQARSSEVNRSCDLLVGSCDACVSEARVTIAQLKALKIAERFAMSVSLGEREIGCDGVRVVRHARPGTWSSELSQALSQLERPYVLFWLDDFVPTSVTSLERLDDLVSWASRAGVNYLRLNPTPRGSGAITAPHIREVSRGEYYRTSTILSIWRRSMLMDLLDASESAWQFEVAGSARSDRFDGFFAHDTAVVETVNLVVKGLVDPRAERVLEDRGIDLSHLDRPRMTRSQLNMLRAQEARSRVLSCLPWQMRRAIRAIRARFGTDLRAAANGGASPKSSTDPR